MVDAELGYKHGYGILVVLIIMGLSLSVLYRGCYLLCGATGLTYLYMRPTYKALQGRITCRVSDTVPF